MLSSASPASASLERPHDGRERQHVGSSRVGGEPGEVAAGGQIRKYQRAGKLAIVAGDDDVLRKAAGRRENPRAQRSDADPRAGGQLEVLGQPAVEDQALRRIVRIDEAHRVAEPVIAFLVERGGGQIRGRASSRA